MVNFNVVCTHACFINLWEFKSARPSSILFFPFFFQRIKKDYMQIQRDISSVWRAGGKGKSCTA